MLKSTKQLHMFFLLFFITFGSLFAQEVGKIFNKSEAEDLFGVVLEYKEMNCDALKEILLVTDDKVMFLFKNNQVTILGDSRKLLHSTTSFKDENQVFRLFNKSKVLELIKKGGKSTLRFENRKDVFTITNGGYTLDLSNPCPPYCG